MDYIRSGPDSACLTTVDSDQVIGHVDRAISRLQPDGRRAVLLEGWVLHTRRPIVRLDIGVAGGQPVPAQKVIRTDVAARLRDVPHAVGAGFRARLLLPPALDSTIRVALAGVFDDGTTLNAELDVMLESERPGGQDSFEDFRDGVAPERSLESVRRLVQEQQRVTLSLFLSSGATLKFPRPAAPQVSVILVLHNRADCTLSALRSLLEQHDVPFELIVVDNYSTDETPVLLDRVDGPLVLRQTSNRHFIAACNLGAAQASAPYLLFLNNDVQLLPGALAAALESISSSSKVGVVGGRVLHPNGRLQEAGSRVYRDGSTAGIGVGDDPALPQYADRRAVDYCSGAFLLTPRTLFSELGGFSPAFSPAYYEDVDYCARVRLAGHSVIYEPRVNLFHLESASSSGSAAARALMDKNREIFRTRHSRFLAGLPEAQNPDSPLFTASSGGLTLLMIDDFLPSRELGQGMARSLLIVRSLADEGVRVYFLPMNSGTAAQESFLKSLSPLIDVLPAGSAETLPSVIDQFGSLIDAILVSRPHNMERLDAALKRVNPRYAATPILYDAEAVFTVREILKAQVEQGLILTANEISSVLSKELILARSATSVLCVSEREAALFRQYGVPDVTVLGYGLRPTPTPRPFAERRGFLTVGPMLEKHTPNSDAVRWFLDEVQPRLRLSIAELDLQFSVAGLCKATDLQSRQRLAQRHFTLLGVVPELFSVYDRHKVFVAAARYGAGIPLKVIEAAAYGIPVVCSSLLADQLGWEAGKELSVASSPEEFAVCCERLVKDPVLWVAQRDAALRRVQQQYSPESFTRVLKAAVRHAVPVSAPMALDMDACAAALL